MAALAQATMEDFQPAAATKAALLLVIGEPVSEDHKHLIPEELAKGFRTWDVEATGVDINEEVCKVASLASLGGEGIYVNSFGPLKPGERVMNCSTGPLSVEVLISPQTTTVKRALKNFLGAPVKYHHLIYAGHALLGTGEWILQDDTFTFNDFAATFKDPDVENALKQQEESTLNIHCFATGDWNNANLSKVGPKVLQMNLNPEDKLSKLDGVTQFNTYVCDFVKTRSLKEMLRSSDVVGNIRFSKPTLYVFPGCQGDSALFGINGFNLLVNGGYNKKACFWDFTRHLDRIDAILLTHLGIDNVFGMNSVLQRKSIENVHPEIGHMYFNAYKGSKNSQDVETNVNSNDSLLINIAVEGDKIVDNVRLLGQAPNPCSRSATAPTIEPVNLYHKVGHGSLDMYILNPIQDSKELKEFYQQWSKQAVQFSSASQFSLANTLSVCSLLIWRPADPTENITRIFFPGNAPQHKILEGLEKLKTLNVLKVPKCCDKELNAPKAALKKSVPSKSLGSSRPLSKVSATKTETIKRESKVELKSKAPAARTNKVSKEDTNNKKASKTKEKGDKPKSAISKSPKISPPTEVPPAVPEPIKESPPDLVQQKDNVLVDFGSASEQQHAPPASDALLDLIGHSSMKAESEQLLTSDPASFMNNQSPDPLPDPTHVDHDSAKQPEDDQINCGLNHKEMEDMGIYDDDYDPMVQRERSDYAVEADKLVSSSSDDKGFEEYDEEVQPESLPEPDLIMGSHTLQYDNSIQEFGPGLDAMCAETHASVMQERSYMMEEEILVCEKADTVESMPPSVGFEDMNKYVESPSTMDYEHERDELPEDDFEQDLHSRDFSPNADMTNSVYGNLMERSVPSAEAFEQLQQECEEMQNRLDENSSPEDFERSSPDVIEKDSSLVCEELRSPEPVENAYSPEPVENTYSPEPVENTYSPEPVEEAHSPEPVEEEHSPELVKDTYSPEPVEEAHSPEPVEEAHSPEPVEEAHSPEPVEDAHSPEPVEDAHSPEPVEDAHSPEPVEEAHSPDPVEDARSPDPVEDAHSPDPVEDAHSPDPVEDAHSPDPVEDAHSPEPVEDAHSPEPVEEAHSPEPVEEAHSPEPVEEAHSPEPVEEAHSPEPVEEAHSPEPVEEAHSPEPVEEAHSPEPVEEAHSPEPVEDDFEEDTPKDEDERSSPEGFNDQPNEEHPGEFDHHSKENAGLDGDATEGFGMHHSDSGTKFDEQAEDFAAKESDNQMLKNENEDDGIYDDDDSEEVASQPEGDQLHQMGMSDQELTPNVPESDMDSESPVTTSLPAAFEKDETPQPGDKPAAVCSDQEERDDTDSIDGGTPEDEKDIDETFNPSAQQASDFDSSTPHPAWSTSNLSPHAPPFDPSGNTAFDPFGQQGPNNFSEDEKNHDTTGQYQEHGSGFETEPEKPFDPAEEWGQPMNLPSPPPPEVKKSNGLATKKPTSRSPTARTDRKLADTKKTDSKRPTSTLGRSPKPALDRKAGLAKTEKPEKKLSNGDADTKPKPRSAIGSSLDKSKSSHSTTERKPLTKTRPLSAASSKLETKTANGALKSETRPKLSSAKRPSSTTTGSRASPATKAAPPLPPHTTFYVDLTYIPNHGDPTYSDIEFFKRIRARYYVLSALSPNPQILNALLEAKETWEDKNLEVTVIPTYDNETLKHWMGLHKETLTNLKIDVAPSANRCTIQLQDHETSCSAYRLEF